jgi:histidinol dehydrogenase
MGDLLRILNQPSEALQELQSLRVHSPLRPAQQDWPRLQLILESLEAVRNQEDPLLFGPTACSGVRISGSEIDVAYQQISQAVLGAIQEAIAAWENFYRPQLLTPRVHFENGGRVVAHRTYARRRVGLYLSQEGPQLGNLLRQAVAARIVGVPEIILMVGGEAKIAPEILMAAQLCGIEEIYQLKGVRAIGALAYGTEQIRPVECITGVGEPEVMLAKQLVGSWLVTDCPQLYSNFVVVADHAAEPQLLALDLLIQSYQNPQTALLVLTSDDMVARDLQKWLTHFCQNFSWGLLTEKAITHYGLLGRLENLEQSIELVNAIEPQYLSLAVSDPWSLVEKIQRAQTILMGPQTTRRAIDYGGGSALLVTPTSLTSLSLNLFFKTSHLVENPQALGSSAYQLLQAKDIPPLATTN